MRSLFAIFFSVLLMVSQAASFDGSSPAVANRVANVAKCCGHCGPCKAASCCVAKNESGSRQEAPAVPAQRSSQNDLQILASASLQVLPQISTESAVVPASPLLRPSIAAPLYQRDCSYLI